MRIQNRTELAPSPRLSRRSFIGTVVAAFTPPAASLGAQQRGAPSVGAAAGSEISQSPGWKGFRGDGTGVGLGKNYPSVLDATSQRWQAKDVAPGHSSPVV